MLDFFALPKSSSNPFVQSSKLVILMNIGRSKRSVWFVSVNLELQRTALVIIVIVSIDAIKETCLKLLDQTAYERVS